MKPEDDFSILNGIPVEQMTDAQLAAFSRTLEEAKAGRIIAGFTSVRENYIDAVAKIEEAVKPYGLDAARFITMTPAALRAHIMNRLDAGRGNSNARTTRVAPKYRNPSNHEQTWTGRGNKPHWVRDFEKGGGKLEDTRIPPEDSDSTS